MRLNFRISMEYILMDQPTWLGVFVGWLFSPYEQGVDGENGYPPLTLGELEERDSLTIVEELVTGLFSVGPLLKETSLV